MSFRSRMIVTLTLATSAPFARAGTFATTLLDYAPGTISSSSLQQSGNAALGLPTSTDDGQTSPFTPPYHASSITIIGAGGHITLQFGQPVLTNVGLDIGVFTNTGIVAKVSNGTVSAGSPAAAFSSDNAVVSVSDDGSSWFTLNDGDPLNLTVPSNAFLDGTLSSSGGITLSNGTTPADPYKPFAGSLSDFSGLTYPQMLTLLNGSFGGTWLDASASNLPEINFIRFDVPTGDRLVLDAVTGITAVPEPASLGLLVLGGTALILRRRSVLSH